MHQYLKAIRYENLKTKKDLRQLLEQVETEFTHQRVVSYTEEADFCELQKEYGYRKEDLLSREDVQMYQFVPDNNGKTHLEALEATKYGFVVPTFNNALEKIVEEVYAFQED